MEITKQEKDRQLATILWGLFLGFNLGWVTVMQFGLL